MTEHDMKMYDFCFQNFQDDWNREPSIELAVLQQREWHGMARHGME
jgi:hypothetical protein